MDEKSLELFLAGLDLKIKKSNNQERIAQWIQMPEEEKMRLAFSAMKLYGAKDWNLLPPEMKREYIKYLEFPDLLKLRLTASSERALVDSLTVDFPSVKFQNQKKQRIYWHLRPPTKDCHLEIEYLLHNAPKEYPFIGPWRLGCPSYSPPVGRKLLNFEDRKTYQTAIELLIYVLKIGRVNQLRIEDVGAPDRFNRRLKKFEKSAPFLVNHLNIKAKKLAVEFFLYNVEGVESITLDAEASLLFPFDDFLEIPVISEVPLLIIKSLRIPTVASKLAEKWIDTDAEIGNKLRCSVSSTGKEFLKIFAETFRLRMDCKKETHVRILTDNPAKHILMMYLHHRDEDKCCILCEVIPAELEESEYESYHPWVYDIPYVAEFYLFGEESMWAELRTDFSLETVPTMGDMIAFSVREQFPNLQHPLHFQ